MMKNIKFMLLALSSAFVMQSSHCMKGLASKAQPEESIFETTESLNLGPKLPMYRRLFKLKQKEERARKQLQQLISKTKDPVVKQELAEISNTLKQESTTQSESNYSEFSPTESRYSSFK